MKEGEFDLDRFRREQQFIDAITRLKTERSVERKRRNSNRILFFCVSLFSGALTGVACFIISMVFGGNIFARYYNRKLPKSCTEEKSTQVEDQDAHVNASDEIVQLKLSTDNHKNQQIEPILAPTETLEDCPTPKIVVEDELSNKQPITDLKPVVEKAKSSKTTPKMKPWERKNKNAAS
ncbi:C2cd3 [Acrasis kona]|uniref:C2cd3 n=1 Tax=Acrasis kona TaxID=1008807 RepID=A0AAW2ZQB1_9EUKA